MSADATSSSKGQITTAIISGLFLIASVCVGAYLKERPAPNSVFSGVVRAVSGAPISHARIVIAQDQQVPQVTFSDVDGIFHVQLSSKIESLRVSVSADGYVNLDKDANLHRTGPEELYLQPAIRQPSSKQGTPTISTHGTNSPIVLGDNNTVAHSR